MKFNNNQQAFLALVRGGLWETEVQLLPYRDIDYNEIYKLAQEQAVVGLVAAGLEHVHDSIIPKEVILTFIGDALQLEQRNIAMNEFIKLTVDRMHAAGIDSMLVKGQGIAQCYERPLWRACGDVDFILDNNNYTKAKAFLMSQADSFEEEIVSRKHIGLIISGWCVELHGSLKGGVSEKVDCFLEKQLNLSFKSNRTRSWINDNTEILLPEVNDDIIFVFTHILQHYWGNGIGLRQICDWARLLWSYEKSIKRELLECRLSMMGIKSEWMAFANLAVDYLGLPRDFMPLYSSNSRWTRKATHILCYIYKVGNFGFKKNNDYLNRKAVFIRRGISLLRYTKDAVRNITIFPKDSISIWYRKIKAGFTNNDD